MRGGRAPKEDRAMIMPFYKNRSDEELMSLLAHGDRGAFDELFNRYYHQIYNYVRRSVNNVEAAEDVTQEIFLRVIKSANRFDPERKFQSWIYKIASNEIKRHLKRAKLRQAISLNDPVGDEEDGAERGDFLMSPYESPEEYAERQAMAAELRRAIESLPEKQRQVVVLKIFEGLTFQEIAEVMNAPLSTVLSRMRYALDKLKRHFGVDLEKELGQSLDDKD